jgi:protein-tyrosine-phosphatase
LAIAAIPGLGGAAECDARPRGAIEAMTFRPAIMVTAGPMEWIAAESRAPRVVFVCEHGTVKSVIAMALFNKMAEERGLAARALSRGLASEPSVPAAIAEHLRADGLALGGFRPAPLAKSDLAGALRVVAIGVDTGPVTSGGAVPVERWDDIPPASVDYEAARNALRGRIDELLGALASPGK